MEKHFQNVCESFETFHHETIRHDNQMFTSRRFFKRKSTKSQRDVELDPSTSGGIYGEQSRARELPVEQKGEADSLGTL